jgi:hypothetical protein
VTPVRESAAARPDPDPFLLRIREVCTWNSDL